MKQLMMAAMLAVFSPVAALAATFHGEAYSYTGGNGVALALAEVDKGSPEATFDASSIVTFAAASTEDIGTVLGRIGTNVQVDTSFSFVKAVIRWSGFVDIAAGNHTFFRNTNDGFILRIGGTEVLRYETQGYVTDSFTLAQGGVQAFELVYFNNAANGHLELKIDGGSVAAAKAPDVGAVPLPAGLPLVMSGVAALALLRRKRTA